MMIHYIFNTSLDQSLSAEGSWRIVFEQKDFWSLIYWISNGAFTILPLEPNPGPSTPPQVH